MLPILRILPVGGVLLAILILVLALSPPDGSRAPLSSAMATGRGVLADRDRQSEVRQYLIHAALKRAADTCFSIAAERVGPGGQGIR